MAAVADVLPLVTSLMLLIASILLNSMGVYLLSNYGNKTSNQRLIMIHLSGTELALATTEIVYWSFVWAGHEEETSVILQSIVIINAGIFGTYYLVLIALTLDRLLASVLTIRHLTICSKPRVIKALLVAWVLGLTSSIPFFTIEFENIYDIYYKVNFLCLDTIFLSCAILTYSYILAQILKRRQKIRDQALSRTNHSISLTGQSQYYKVTTFIIVSFIFLVAIPDIVYIHRFIITEVGSSIEESIIEIVWQLNFLVDPVIYIFCQKTLIKGFFKTLRKLGWKRDSQRIGTEITTVRGSAC